MSDQANNKRINKEAKRDYLEKYRPEYVEIGHRYSDKALQIGLVLYRSVITICAGALVVSMTTYKKIFPEGHDIELLIFSWLGFGLAMVLTLLEAFITINIFNRQISLFNRHLREVQQWEEGEFPKPKITKLNLVVYSIQGIIVLLFSTACVLMGYFVYLNYK